MPTVDPSPTSAFVSDAPDPWRPLARLDHLVMTQVRDEVLVYDQATHHIHHLNPTSHAVWAACDGARTVPAIAQAVGAALGAEVSLEVVNLALGQLGEANLLVGALPTVERESRSSRRTMVRRLAIAGGVALPALASISAPTAAQSSSLSCEAQGGLSLGDPCTATVQCCSGNCAANVCAVFIPPTSVPPDTAACGRPCGSSADCGGVCGTCRDVNSGTPDLPVIFLCL